MSANYNTSLFRQLQAPLLDALGQIETGLQKLLESQIQAKELGLVDKAHEVTSSLKIVKRNAVANLAETIEKGIVFLSAPERQGWDFIQIQSVARALLPLVSAFSLHLKDMVAGNDALHVQLWPLWAKACAVMELPAPEVEDLFEIDPDFSGETFQLRPEEYLNTVVTGANERLVLAIGAVEAARNKSEMEAALRKATEVFNQIYALRHHRAYQPYWLIVRARLAVGLMLPEKLLDQREEWLSLLREASIQLRKFGADSRRMSEKTLREALKPLMKPWPKEWAMAHPTLAELDRRLGLSVFWQAAKDVREEADEGALAQFSARQKDLSENIGQLKNHWNKLISAPEEQRKSALAGFLRSLVAFGPKKEWFPGGFVAPLFEGMRGLGDKLAERLKAKEQPPIDERLAFEVASTILLLDEVVERRARWHKDLETRCQTQAYRLGLAIAGRYEELSGMPTLHWDAKWKARQVDKAVRDALGLVQQQLATVEKALVELSRGDDEQEIRDRFDELKGRCRQVGLVLETLRQPLAAKVTKGLRDQIEGLVTAKNLDVPLRQMALALASLQRYIQSKKNGDAEDLALLGPGLEALFGQGSYAREIQALHDGNAMSPPVAALEGLAELSVEAMPVPAQDKEEASVAVPSAEVEVPASQASVPSRDLRAELLGQGALDTPSAPDILEIFLEEADVALEEARAHRVNLLGGSQDEEEWAGLRRQFHTLKGSGRICGLVALGEVAWWVEERLNEALVAQEAYSQALDEALELASVRLSAWYEQLRSGQTEVLVQAGDVKEAIDRALPFFGEAASAEEGAAPAGEAVETAEDDFSGIWPSGLDAEPTQVSLEEALSQSALVEPHAEEEAIEPAADAVAVDAMDELVRDDALKHAQNLAEVMLNYELGGQWNWESLHWSAHTVAGLAPEGHDIRPLAKSVEAWAESAMSGVVVDIPAEKSLPAVETLRGFCDSLASGNEMVVSPDIQAAFDGAWMEGSRDDGQDWSLDFTETDVEILEVLPAEPAQESDSDLVTDPLEVVPVELGFNVPDAAEETAAGDVPEAEAEAEAEAELPERARDEAESASSLLETDAEANRFEAEVSLAGSDSEPLEVVAEEESPVDTEEAGPSELGSVEIPEETQPLVEGSDAVTFDPEEMDERDVLWEEVFSALDTIQGGFKQLSQALLKLNQRDYRD